MSAAMTHLLLSLLLVSPTRRAAPAATDSLPSCVEDLEGMKSKLEADYAGYRLEVAPRPARYLEALATLRARAERTPGDDCYYVLRDFIAWFHDPHLFVYQPARLDSVESIRRAGSVRIVATTEPAVRHDLDRRAGRLDPLEGIWYDGALRVAIMADSAAPKGSFVAVVLTPDSANWAPGAVRARFLRRTDGGYDADLSARNYAVQHRDARIYKRVLLRLSPGMWGKEYPVKPADRGLLDPLDPHRATLLERNGTIVVSIPSHDPGYGAAFDSLVAANAEALRTAERLIVDLRGNEGGSAGMTDRLMPYIRSEHQPPSPLEFRNTTILSSPDQIHYVSVAFGSDSEPPIRRLLARMESHPGEVVPLFDSLFEWPPAQPDSVIRGPARVGVLIDGGTVSASEVMLLEAKRSDRVTVYGEPTAGALYYQSTTIVWFSPRERRWGLGYPTQIAGEWTPGPDTHREGIAPTVRVDLTRLADPIGWVEARLRQR